MEEDVFQRTQLKVNRVLDQFLEDLDSRTSSQEFSDLLFGRTSLTDVSLGYKPEVYTRFNLIEPLLSAVALDYQLEPRSANLYRKRWPDIKVTSTDIPYIMEVKPMNDVERGVEDIKEYLSIEGFESPYGILTDGIDWYVFGPPESGGRTSNPVERNYHSLSDAAKTIALSEGYWDVDLLSSEIQSNGINQIQKFPKIFHRDQIDVWALEKMPRQYRRDFLSTNRSLQASLEGMWE